ncbi:Arc family DNA-binding protein [Agathobaculum sp. NTUH-O15-33]|uniref:Arc family DNA-binding protein n=1 Tax=Agathobaculum sp. NTUH-O15-33 TaxID=3079302 RepID=UPI0029587D1B|nr:Arc family DNA-binding protein [Agathobaculum sp. NTUH-O15-33]WNX85020.1 Arc family DNA-binding protein [Agathobaculum sp. NTUH-O15-33]
MAFDENEYKMNYDRENYERIAFRVPKGKREELRQYAKNQGESVNALIIKCLEQYTQLNLSNQD